MNGERLTCMGQLGEAMKRVKDLTDNQRLRETCSRQTALSHNAPNTVAMMKTREINSY